MKDTRSCLAKVFSFGCSNRALRPGGKAVSFTDVY